MRAPAEDTVDDGDTRSVGFKPYSINGQLSHEHRRQPG